MIEFGPEICRDFAVATKREWVEANGIGGYASSTILLTNTRRYHGLLVAALNAPVNRALLLAKLDETLIVDGSRHDLFTNQYADIVYPHGYQKLESFRLDPYPTFTFEVPGGRLEKSLFLVHGENTLVVFYRLLGTLAAELEVRPLVAFRPFHELSRENDGLNRVPEAQNGLLRIRPFAGMPALAFAHGASFRQEGYWYKNFEYVEEAYRGYSFREDLFSYGSWTLGLPPNSEAALVVTTADALLRDPVELRERERERRAAIVRDARSSGDAARCLVAAADQFLVRRRDLGASVIAGYPWFAEGCRDAAIALPGLAISTGRFGDARDVIRRLLATAERGLLPATFSEDGQDASPSQPAADSSLWLFVAVHEYLRATGDDLFVRDELAAVLLPILDAYAGGTDYGITCDGDGMIATAAPGVPLTWMNARVNEWIATERAGTPVELAALWVNALRIGEEIARGAGRATDAARYASIAEKAAASFRRLFWDEATGTLRDVVGASGIDATLRPNQVIALGLPYALLPDADASRVLAAVRKKLLTPVGLRTLPAEDTGYRGRYVGDAWLREKAYHQGSAWPWLLGAYVRALLRHEGAAAAPEARACLEFVDAHLADAGLGTVSELFDGDAPHTPRGAIARCLSVAEVLRALKAIEAI